MRRRGATVREPESRRAGICSCDSLSFPLNSSPKDTNRLAYSNAANSTNSPAPARELWPADWRLEKWWLGLVLLGVALRLAIIVLPGNQIRAPWSGGGDASVYVLLAENILHGRGFTYAGQPTALRAPGYPLLLSSLMWLFGGKFVVAVRWVQFALGLGTAFFCARTSELLFGKNAGRAAFAVSLFFPTLLFVTDEVLTETVAAFLCSVFFFIAVKAILSPRMLLLAELGLITSLAALFRFNMALLGIVAIWLALAVKVWRPAWQLVLVVCVTAGLAISPWIVRNIIAFRGQTLYSTLSGHDAVEGVLTPQGRAFPGDEDRIRRAEGWVLGDIETNAPSRLSFPSEAVLNQRAWTAAERLWPEYGWRLAPIEAAKLAHFWLSTDQVFWTQAFNFRQRLLRWCGVLVYWVLLGLAILGWVQARRMLPVFAGCLLFYAVIVTLLHLPFPMLTRLRIPFMDPVLAMLGGAAVGVRIGSTPRG